MSAILIHDILQKMIMLEWRTLSQHFIDKRISEWRRCLQCVMDQNGRHTEHMFH